MDKIIEKINIRTQKPKDYHCNCKYCSKLFRGELLKENGTYFSGRERIGYSDYEKKNKHICKGHSVGYRFVIENYTKERDSILDPFAGSGTAMVESAKLNRESTGIELEFYDILKENSKLYPKMISCYKGDSLKKIDSLKRKFQLIVSGFPYNHKADPPERKNLKTGDNKTFDYSKKENPAFLSDPDYSIWMSKLIGKCYNKTRKGGYFSIIIKDPIRKKEPYLLHVILGEIAERIGFKPTDVWIHRHYPPTLFMSTYNKRFPNVKIPKYQTILVMQKN